LRTGKLIDDSLMQVLAKIESADAVENLDQILDAVDGAMVARGDLGAELPVEMVPFWQSQIIQVLNRPPLLTAPRLCQRAQFMTQTKMCFHQSFISPVQSQTHSRCAVRVASSALRLSN
jgi:hypothetical protein